MNTKLKFLILFLILLPSSLGIYNNSSDSNFKTDFQETDNLIETGSDKPTTKAQNIHEETTTIQTTNSETKIQDPVNTEQWYQGESVKVDHLFQDDYPPLFTIDSDITNTTLETKNLLNTRTSNDAYYTLEATGGMSTYFNQIYSIYKIYPQGRSINITVEGYSKWVTGGTPHSTTDTADSVLIPTGYDEITIQIQTSTADSGLKQLYFEMWIPETGDFLTIDTLLPGAIGLPAELWQYIDQIYYEYVDVTEIVRSGYQVADHGQTLHRLEINNLAYNNELRIYSNLGWTLSSINYNAEYIWNSVSNYWSINNTIPAMYSIMFLSNSTNIVALSDHSSDYLQNEGFESGSYLVDWTIRGGAEFETVQIDTSIVSEGSFSLKIENTAGTFGILDLKLLDDGEYYFSFDIYIESYSGSANQFVLYGYDGGSYPNFDIDETIQNRWQKHFLFVNVDGGVTSTYGSMFFQVGGSVLLTAYLDNFRIWKPSGQQTNLGLSEYEFSSSFIYWDGYQNPSATNIDVEWSLRDRTADTEIISKSLITDNLGYAYYNFQGTLEMKEYTSEWVSYDSWFSTSNNDWFSMTESIMSWSEGAIETGGIFGLNYIKITKQTGGTGVQWFNYNPSNTWDLTNDDFVIYHYQTEATSEFSLQILTSGGNAFEYLSPTFPTSEWTIHQSRISEYTLIVGNPDITSINSMQWEFRGAISTYYKHYLDGFRTIIAQKTYFTPIPASYDVSSQETKQDGTNGYWDYSDSVMPSGLTWRTSQPEVNGQIINGMAQMDIPYAWRGLQSDSTEFIPIDVSYFNIMIVRWRANESGALLYSGNTVDGGSVNLGTQTSIADTWQIYEKTFPVGSLELTTMVFEVWSGSVNIIHLDVDYIYYAHKDTVSLYETENYFYLDSENSTLGYNIQHDTLNYTVFDQEIIWKNQTVGSHQIDYQAIYSIDPDESRFEFLQLADTLYTHSYEVIFEFDVQVQDFSLSDYYVQSYVVASKDYTYVVKENGSTIASGSGLSEGTSIQTVRNISPGYLINYVIEFTNSTDTITFTSSYSNAAQVISDDLAIEGLKPPEYDTSTGLVSFFISTNWENTTITVYQNGSSIGSNIEGVNSVFTFDNSYGSWNFTYLIDGGSESFVFEEWVTINKPGIEKTLVHFRLSNEAGVGLDFITTKIMVNETTITAADRYYLPGIFLNISIYSWANDLILTKNVTVESSEQDIIMIVPIIEQEFNNKNDFAVLINLKSSSNTNYSISYVVSSSSSLILEMFAGDFVATFTPLDAPNGDNGTHILAYSSITRALEIRKGLSAVNVVTSLVATKLEDVRISYFERYILGPMLVVFGTLSLIGIFVALIFFGFRSLLANIIRENLLEPGAQKVGDTSGIYDLSDSDDISLNKRKLSYKNKHI